MDRTLANLMELRRVAQPDRPAADLVESLFRVPVVRDFLLGLPPGHPDPLGKLQAHFAERPDILALLDAYIELAAARMAAANHAAAQIANIARRN